MKIRTKKVYDEGKGKKRIIVEVEGLAEYEDLPVVYREGPNAVWLGSYDNKAAIGVSIMGSKGPDDVQFHHKFIHESYFEEDFVIFLERIKIGIKTLEAFPGWEGIKIGIKNLKAFPRWEGEETFII